VEAAPTAPAISVSEASRARPAWVSHQAPARATPGASAKLHYTGVAGVRVRGPETGRMYVFSGAHPDAAVDRRDVDGLIRIGLFRRGA
jgi:hypothetical protein